MDTDLWLLLKPSHELDCSYIIIIILLEIDTELLCFDLSDNWKSLLALDTIFVMIIFDILTYTGYFC